MTRAATTAPVRPGLASLPPLFIGRHRLPRPIVLAPMAGVSEAPYRAMALALGAGLAPTELVSSKGLEFGNRRTEAYLRHQPTEEPIFTVQLYGGEPRAMAFAAERTAARGAKILDVNMGCPVKKVTRNGAGSALMADPLRAAAVVRAMRDGVGDELPVTVKLRAGWDEGSKNAPDVGRVLEDAGAAAIALHPRTRQAGYEGKADWSLIGSLVRAVRIPVIANGDVFTVADADRIVAETGAAGVMVGRAALGDPWIFARLAAAYDGRPVPAPPTGPALAAHVRAHLAAHLDHHGEPGSARPFALKRFRPHLAWYSRGLPGGARFRQEVNTMEERAAVEAAIDRFFSAAALADPSEAPIFDPRTALG